MRRSKWIPIASLWLAAACASGPPRVSPAIASATFHPDLDVEIAAMTRTRSGAYYKDVAVGTGPAAPRTSQVIVRYALYLADGTLLEGGLNDAPVSVTLGSGAVIRAWDEAIPGMRIGGIRKVVAPPDLAYGRRGTGRVPPNAVLVFDIQLMSVR